MKYALLFSFFILAGCDFLTQRSVVVNDRTIIFDLQGGTALDGTALGKITLPYGESTNLPEAKFAGYFFDGWFSAAEGGIRYGSGGDKFVLESNLTMYARWRLILKKDEGDSIINGIVFVFVEAGTFIMGSPPDEAGRFSDEVQRQTTITESFWISKYPITNRQYGNLATGREDYPATNITWQEALSFAESKGGRLPTEAEWEFAARGGNESGGYIFSGSNDLNAVGWYFNNSGNRLQKVGQKKSNELGIYDMSGNVDEWCMDWYNIYDDTAVIDPDGESGAEFQIGRIIRGGSFNGKERDCRVADRPFADPSDRYESLGFRIYRPF